MNSLVLRFCCRIFRPIASILPFPYSKCSAFWPAEVSDKSVSNWWASAVVIVLVRSIQYVIILLSFIERCLLHDVDLEKAKKIELSKRSTFLEESVITDYIVKQGLAIPKNAPTDMALNFDNSVEKAHKLSSPRLVKSHLPFCTLPEDAFKKGKVILCLRNPKDTVVSYFHHEKLVNFQWFLDDFKASFDIFMNDLMPYGSYWSYTLAAWEKRNHPNVCLLFFEDMKQDLEGSVRKVARFLNKDLSSEQVEALVEHLSFKKMKGNTAVNKEQFKDFGFADKSGSFMRKGQIGDWKNYLTDEMNQRMDEAIEKHFKGTGLEFRYE